jgi:hypothetical protein
MIRGKTVHTTFNVVLSIILLILLYIFLRIKTEEHFSHTESASEPTPQPVSQSAPQHSASPQPSPQPEKKKNNKRQRRRNRKNYPSYYTYGSYPYPVIRDRSYPNPYYMTDPYYYLMNRYDDDITFYRDTYNASPYSYANYRTIEPEYCWRKIKGDSVQQLVRLAKQFGISTVQVPRYNANHILIPSTSDCYLDKFGDKSMYDMYVI